MNVVPSEKIRNVALVGHAGAGKTTLGEALLFRSEAIARMGDVTAGTTVLDADEEEIARQQSLGLALAPVMWHGHKINLIDVPGYADFAGALQAALHVADMAVFVVSAVDGVEAQTEAAWRIAGQLGLPRMFFVNKLDRERASFERTRDELLERFGAGVAPIEIPVGEETSFRGVVDLLTDRAYVYDSGDAVETEVPAEMAGTEHDQHDTLVENIVVADDALLERYLDGDVPTAAELEATLAKGVASGAVFPIVCGAASVPIGVDRLATMICELGPAPSDRPPVTARAGDTEVEIACDADADPLAFVFSTVIDPYLGRLSLMKVLSGTVRNDDHLVNPRTGAVERLHGIQALRGKEHLEVHEAPAGDLVAVPKLSDTATGDTLAPKGTPVTVAGFEPPSPVYALAVAARSQTDEDKLAQALHRVVEEDSSIRVTRNDETHQTLLEGMGETHLQVTLARIQRKFGIEVDTGVPRVPYRETIAGPATAEGKHKKQSGGHGQFGVVHLTVEPLERGAGFDFVDEIVGGAISRTYVPAVSKGIEEAMVEGGPHGFPVVDVRVTLHDGKEHAVDSSEMAFKMAGRTGFRSALESAGTTVLEPVSLVEVTVPTTHQGDVMGDLNARRGRVQGTDTTPAGDQVITALVPAAEIQHYAIDLRSLTGGRGQVRVRHDHYDPLPAHLVDRVVES